MINVDFKRVRNWLYLEDFSKLYELLEITCRNNTFRKNASETFKLLIWKKKEDGEWDHNRSFGLSWDNNSQSNFKNIYLAEKVLMKRDGGLFYFILFISLLCCNSCWPNLVNVDDSISQFGRRRVILTKYLLARRECICIQSPRMFEKNREGKETNANITKSHFPSSEKPI